MNQTREKVFNSKEPIDLKNWITPPPSDELIKCRVTYMNEVKTVEYATYHQREVNLLQLIEDDNIEYHYKLADRSCLNRLFSKKGEADDVIIVKNNKLTDTSIANIALFNGNEWITPREPLLKGTRRMELLNNGTIVEGDISLNNLDEYTHITYFNAMIDFKSVVLPTSAVLKV